MIREWLGINKLYAAIVELYSLLDKQGNTTAAALTSSLQAVINPPVEPYPQPRVYKRVDSMLDEEYVVHYLTNLRQPVSYSFIGKDNAIGFAQATFRHGGAPVYKDKDEWKPLPRITYPVEEEYDEV